MGTDRKLEESLSHAQSYRDFLQIYLREKNYSSGRFALDCGCHRSFPSDVISGRRNLTPRSYLSFRASLKVSEEAKALFHSLAATEIPESVADRSSVNLLSEIKRLKRHLRRSQRLTVKTLGEKSPLALADYYDIQKVFAAISKQNNFNSIAQIARRSRLIESRVDTLVEKLAKAGLVRAVQIGPTTTWEPATTHVFLKAEERRVILRSVFSEACKQATMRLAESDPASKEFFFTSSFLVKRERMPELRAALRTMLLDFIEKEIEEDGDRVSQLLVALHF